jgi:hypothetical protein
MYAGNDEKGLVAQLGVAAEQDTAVDGVRRPPG